MGNVLDNISKDNTRFTIFENDQVLTADQLNDLFNYLDVQTRLTRTQAIGVGIITGLEIGLLNNKHLVVSKGAAITTDGDLLLFQNDQEFDQYDTFEDKNAKYPYFHLDTDQTIPMFLLSNSQLVGATPGKNLSTLEDTTGTVFKDYVGILYLEDYDNDPDLCTGTDCDNKGMVAVKDLKVLLVHKNNVRTLLQSMPSMNKDYFALDDLNIPRVTVSTAIDTYAELNASFNNVLAVKDDIKNKLTKAYQVCQLIVEDEFDSGDPTTNWGTLLDQYFTAATTTSTQYVYDFARDISYAYNEMRESLFSDDMLASPDVDLFPKHVLLGLVRDATVKNPIITLPGVGGPIRELPTINTRAINNLLNPRAALLSNIRFNIGVLIRRFTPVLIDLEYRHHFYESPILNNNDESDELTRFCFMRIHSMITNFKVPTAAELQNLDQGFKITPSLYEDAELGKRSIPFYYRFNPNLPLNLYWNFRANNRKRENKILSYSANQYAPNDAATFNPLLFNILPYNFFRIEGHIGFKLADVEAALNRVILANNLPINIQSVQVEKKLETIPGRSWYFPHLYMYEKSIKSTFNDSLDNADIVNDNLQAKDQTVPVTEFKTAKQSVLDNSLEIANPKFNMLSYRAAISNVVTAATNIKAQTKQYTFSNAAIPHDFILNSDVIRKTDVISGIYQDSVVKKKTGLMLGNFMKDNPGLEHAGGVLRGGTFVLVYTADDQNVIADFMLPYASIDKDVVPNPPVYTPLPLPLPEGTPFIPRFPLDNVFEIKPTYVKHFEANILPYAKEAELDGVVSQKVASTIDLKMAVTNARIDGIVPQIASFSTRLDDNSGLFKTVLSKDLKTIPSTGLTFGAKDFTADVAGLRQKQLAVQGLTPDDPTRAEKETELVKAAEDLTVKLNDPAVTADTNNSEAVKSVLADVHGATSLIQNANLQPQVSEITNRANVITRSFNR